jgi:hypothetical protein
MKSIEGPVKYEEKLLATGLSIPPFDSPNMFG